MAVAEVVLVEHVAQRPELEQPLPELAARGDVVNLFMNYETLGEHQWADAERDTSAWLGNAMQRQAHESLYALRPAVLATGDAALLRDWRCLTPSDHLDYMCTKHFADGEVRKYFSPWESPYEAHIAFMNALADVALRAGAPAGR